MNEARKVFLEEPRLVDGAPMTIAGLAERHRGTVAEIPAQWQRFVPYLGKIPGQVGRTTYGVIFDWFERAQSFGYLAGVEVERADDLPEPFGHLEIPAQRYAVFRHHGHVSEIRYTMDAIFREWLPRSGRTPANDGTDCFERYDETFDPATGTGGIEIWIPITA